jgi:hypothetical protein
MTRLIQWILFLTIWITCSVAVWAQDVPGLTEEQKEEMKAQLESDIESLQLREDQLEPFKKSTKLHFQQLMALRDSDKPRRIKFREAKKIKSSRNAEMKELLTEEQYQTFLEIQDRRKQEFKDRKNQ